MDEWKILLNQFIAMGMVVKDKVINIDSDLYRILFVYFIPCGCHAEHWERHLQSLLMVVHVAKT
jgi:hypothetical protein